MILKSKFFQKYWLFIAVGIFLTPYFLYGIYPDEIAVQLWTTRFLEDAPLRGSVHPQCTNAFTAEIPYFLYPSAILLAPFSFVNDTRLFRVVTSALLFILIYLIYKIFSIKKKESVFYFVLFLFLILSGTKLFSLVILRAEIFAALTIIYGYFLLVSDNKNILYKIPLICLYLMTVYIHPFAVYFFPAVVLVFRKNILFLLFLISATYFSIDLASFQFFHCDDIKINNWNQTFNLNPIDFIKNPKDWLINFKHNINFGRLEAILNRLTINDDYTNSSFYLPNFKNNIFFWVSNIIAIITFFSSVIYAQFFSIKNIVNYKKVNIEQIYIAFIYIGLTTHMLLNKTNAFYAVNFWYFLYAFFFIVEIQSVSLMRTIKIPFSRYRYTVSIIVFFGIIVSLLVVSQSFSHVGPNISLLDKSYFNKEYRNKVIKKFAECCEYLPKNSFVVDDASYFVLKNIIQYPVPITYAGMFKTEEKIYIEKNITYFIVRCGTLSSYGENKGDVVDGGYGDSNICFKKYER